VRRLGAGVAKEGGMEIQADPTKYVGAAELRSGGAVSIRPIRPEDEPGMVRFHATLSESSVYQRYAGFMRLDARIAHERLARMCLVDPGRVMALVAERAGEIVAVARLIRPPASGDAEFALLVSDALQGEGLGHALLSRLFDVGRDWGLKRIVAEILPGNVAMRGVCRDLGFTFQGRSGANKELRPASMGV
jgi:acetyltransferase